MFVPGLGEVKRDEELDWLLRKPLRVPLLDCDDCVIVLSGYEDDCNKDDFHKAIANLLVASRSVLLKIEKEPYQYYQDFEEYWLDDGNRPITMASI